MKNRVGPPVRGEDFFGRQAFVELVWRKVQAGHVLLAAPRRFGKTSVMYALIDQPRNGFKIVHADLEHMEEPAELITELIVKLSRERGITFNLPGITDALKNILSGAKNTVDEVELFEVKVKLRDNARRDWKELGNSLFAQLAISKVPVLFILDELPMMLDRMAQSDKGREEAISLLRWLRQLRVAPEQQNVHFMVAGSIGIDYVLHQLGEGKSINDFERLRLDPFSQPVAIDFLNGLGASQQIQLSPDCHAKIIELVGEPVPYFLQIMFSEISKFQSLNAVAVSPDDIERIYRNNVLGIDCKTYFEHYYGRLREYYKPQEEKAIKRLLRELAVAGHMNRQTAYALYQAELNRTVDLEEFNSLMTNLEKDFYVKQDNTSFDYYFSCKLLRDWWLRHYGLAV